MPINPATDKPYQTDFNRNLETAGKLQLLPIDPKKFRHLGEGRACPSCIDMTTVYFDKAAAQRIAVCRICGRTFNA
jgi:hypothetical protein